MTSWKSRSVFRSVVFAASHSTVVTFILLISAVCATHNAQIDHSRNYSQGLQVDIAVNTSNVIHITDDKFISVAFTAGDLRHHWHTDSLRSSRLHTLAKGLSPAYLRLGGTRADFAFFEENALENNKPGFINFTFTGKDWDAINIFSRAAGWDFLFDVNEFQRKNNEWDPANFKMLLDYNTKKNYTVAAWQIGNEPNAYHHALGVNMTASQVAEDYIQLRSVLNSKQQYARPFLIGPDITHIHPHKLGSSSKKFLEKFLSVCKDCTNVTSFHSYYLAVSTAKLDDFINPSILDGLKFEIDEIREIVSKYGPHDRKASKIFLTETGDAVPGGVSGISDRYAGGFPYLDKLGMGAREGLGVIMKQQFIGRYCGMVDETSISPRPVYWVAHIHKRLVGQRVLNVTTNGQDIDRLRIYAHCTQTKNTSYESGDVTLIVLNLDKKQTVQLTLPDAFAEKAIDEYLLTPNGEDGLHARYVNLNGIKLEMPSNTTLPELKPSTLKNHQPVVIHPLSYGFYVIRKAMLKICSCIFMVDLSTRRCFIVTNQLIEFDHDRGMQPDGCFQLKIKISPTQNGATQCIAAIVHLKQ